LLTAMLLADVACLAGFFTLLSLPATHVAAFEYLDAAGYLWVYSGLLAALVAPVAAYLLSRRLFADNDQRLRFGAQMAGLTFAFVGVAFYIVSLFFPGDDLHYQGYRLHVRLWLDADKVRQWARTVELPVAPPNPQIPSIPVVRVPSRQWPLTLRLTGMTEGYVAVNKDTREVTLNQRGALGERWGVFIADKGREWDGRHCLLNQPKIWRLADGVWIWTLP
jgi:hypothetical protein